MISRDQWSRWSALLDEALELDDDARNAWLATLREHQPDAAIAVARLLGHASEPVPLIAYERSLQDALHENDHAGTASSGQSFGPWQISHKLGSGGMGEVWLATRGDHLYEGQAAIKLLADGNDIRRLGARFARERNLLARLSHPGIARLLDAGISDMQPYLVLEYVDGVSLLDHAHTHAATVADRLRLTLVIARAVEYAHSRLIVHRDLKPSNVVVTKDGEVKLLDFGIAALLGDEDGSHDMTALTRLYGRGLTLDYAAPEQIAGAATGVGCDIYSLGVMLFELLAGARPLRGERPGRAALEHAVLHTEAPRLSRAIQQPLPADHPTGARPLDVERVRGDLDAIVAKALRKAPEDRYPTMAAFIADLEHWLAHRPVSAGRGDQRYRARLWLRRNRVAAVLTAAVVLSLSVGLALSLWQWRAARAQTARAQAVSAFMSDLFRAADPERTRGENLAVRDLVDAGAQRLVNGSIDDPQIRAQLGAALGSTYVSLSRPDRAVPVLEDALRNSIRADGADAVSSARLQLLLAKAEFQDEQYAAVIERYERAIPTLERAGEALAESTILARNLWAYSLAKQGDFDDADRVIGETRTRVLTAFGTSHWLYVETINDTATLATIRGDWQTARTLLTSIRQQMLRPPTGHRQDALTMRLNLANIYARTGAPGEALEMLRPVVHDYTDLLSSDANQTLVARWFLADTLKRTGQYAACADEYKSLAEARTRISGARHPLTVDVISKVAMCERLRGDRVQSRLHADRAIAALPASDDPPQRTVLRIASTLAALALDDGDTARGLPLLARVRHLIDALNLQTRDDRVWYEVLHAYTQTTHGEVQQALHDYEDARQRAPAAMSTITPDAYYAYLLALAGHRDAARQQLATARANAASRFPATHLIFASLDYVDAMLADSDAARHRALATMKTRGATTPTLPLSPFWFGLI
ncbi:MAG TPA: protein kinase [Solimonas sp.]|nr:protein kinase [Solimonas sp.]